MSDLSRRLYKRIALHDYEAVFAYGGCFHFALRLHERFGYRIRGISKPDHVWCLDEQRAFAIDIRGIYAERLIVQLAAPGLCIQPNDVDPDSIRAKISSGYSKRLSKELFVLADRIINTHERFQSVAPPNRESEISQVIRDASDKALHALHLTTGAPDVSR